MKQSDRADVAKKPYKTPALVRWGTLRDITRAVGNRGASDGGHKSQKRTNY
jgi:hypothetical protein